jgi:hypothetical protein
MVVFNFRCSLPALVKRTSACQTFTRIALGAGGDLLGDPRLDDVSEGDLAGADGSCGVDVDLHAGPDLDGEERALLLVARRRRLDRLEEDDRPAAGKVAAAVESDADVLDGPRRDLEGHREDLDPVAASAGGGTDGQELVAAERVALPVVEDDADLLDLVLLVPDRDHLREGTASGRELEVHLELIDRDLRAGGAWCGQQGSEEDEDGRTRVRPSSSLPATCAGLHACASRV